MPFFGGFELLFVLVPIALVGLLLLGLLVVAVVFRGAEPDPKGRRPLTVYLLVVMLVSLFTTLASGVRIGQVVVRDLVDGGGAGGVIVEPGMRGELEPVVPIPAPSPFPIGPLPGPSVFPFEDGAFEGPGLGGSLDEDVARAPAFPSLRREESTVADVLEALVLGLIALAVYLLHRRWLEGLLAKEGSGG